MQPPRQFRSTQSRNIEALVFLIFGGPPPLTIRLWDGFEILGTGGPAIVRLVSPNALSHLMWAPGELGFARAYVAGSIEIEGDLASALRSLRTAVRWRSRKVVNLLPIIARLATSAQFVSGRPLTPPEEVRLRGRRHSRDRDSAAIAHHYDVSNDFFRLLLGPTMVYTCAIFKGGRSLEDAQREKLEVVAQKLNVHTDLKVLDVGCGWGSLAIHAAQLHGCRVVGITNSRRASGVGENSRSGCGSHAQG